MAEINGGYILTSRKLINSLIMKKPPNYLKVWIYLLSKASFQKHGNLERGQGFVSIPELMEVCTYYIGARPKRATKKEIWNILEWLRNPNGGDYEGDTKETMISTTKVTHGMVYTITKYSYYQDPDKYESNSERDSEGTTKVPTKEKNGNNINKNGLKNEKNEKNKDIDDFFESLWSIYPNKKGKGVITDKKKKETYEMGEEFKRAVERYKKEVAGQEKKFIKHGSTFWNSGYVDYLDKNYEQQESREDYNKKLLEGLDD